MLGHSDFILGMVGQYAILAAIKVMFGLGQCALLLVIDYRNGKY